MTTFFYFIFNHGEDTENKGYLGVFDTIVPIIYIKINIILIDMIQKFLFCTRLISLFY